MNDLKSKLLEFGLSEKEACVYLAMLELGPSSVQDIAKKAGVNRATTYVMLESLKRRGLMSSVDRGKKTMFAAESPEHLLNTVVHELRSVEDKKGRLASAMPQFMALFNAIEDKPRVRFFEGEEGISACREAAAELAKGGSSCIFMHFDAATLNVAKTNEEQRFRLTAKMLPVRVLYSVDPGLEHPVFYKTTNARRLPPDVFSFKGELHIFDTFLLVGTSATRPMGVIIENKDVASLLKAMFELIWKQSDK